MSHCCRGPNYQHPENNVTLSSKYLPIICSAVLASYLSYLCAYYVYMWVHVGIHEVRGCHCCVYIWVHVGMHGSQRLSLGVFLNHFNNIIWDNLSLNLELTNRLLADQWAMGIGLSPPSQHQGHRCLPDFYMGARNYNSSLHAWVAGIFLNEILTPNFYLPTIYWCHVEKRL